MCHGVGSGWDDEKVLEMDGGEHARCHRTDRNGIFYGIYTLPGKKRRLWRPLLPVSPSCWPDPQISDLPAPPAQVTPTAVAPGADSLKHVTRWTVLLVLFPWRALADTVTSSVTLSVTLEFISTVSHSVTENLVLESKVSWFKSSSLCAGGYAGPCEMLPTLTRFFS